MIVTRILVTALIVLIALLAGALFAGGDAGPALSSPAFMTSVIAGALMALLVSGWFINAFQEAGWRRMAVYGLIWVGIGVLLAFAYQVFG